MENIGFIKTYDLTVAGLDTADESALTVSAGEDMSTGDTVISCIFDGEELNFRNEAYFAAFQELRDKLLSKGFGIKCNGSRLNAVSLSKKGNSPEIYLVESGKHAASDDIVNIWDKAEISEFPDSKKQRSFYDRWSRELKAIDARAERKAPKHIKILILIPFVVNILWILVALFGRYVYLVTPRLDTPMLYILLICGGFSMTAGILMALIGTVMAARRRNTLFTILGVITIIAGIVPYVFLYLAVSYHSPRPPAPL